MQIKQNLGLLALETSNCKKPIKNYFTNTKLLFVILVLSMLIVLKVMKDLAAEGMTMVIVTHEMEFAKNVSTRTIFMDDGYIVEDDSPDILFTNPKNDRTKEFLKRFMDK